MTGRSPAGTFFLPFHYAEAAANLLTLEKIDPRAKIPDFKMAAIRVQRAEGPPATTNGDAHLESDGAIKDPVRFVH